jgi:hypothetical protein
MAVPLDGLITARRLAHFCPTSLSMEDVSTPSSRAKNAAKFIPPAPSVVTEASSKFRVPAARHRFAFLLSEIKPIETERPALAKMRYDLPNIKRLPASLKGAEPVVVVSLSDSALDRGTTESDNAAAARSQNEKPCVH